MKFRDCVKNSEDQKRKLHEVTVRLGLSTHVAFNQLANKLIDEGLDADLTKQEMDIVHIFL